MPISQEVKATDFDSVIHGFDSHMGYEGGCMVYIDGKPFGAIENVELPRIECNTSYIPGEWSMDSVFRPTGKSRKRL